jgi:phosphatidate cytidylyltransferase
VTEAAAPTATRRRFGDLARRVGTAVVVLPLLVAGMLWAPAPVGLGIVGVAVAIGFREYLELLTARGLSPFSLPGALVAAATFAQVAFSGWPGVPLAPVAMLLALMPVLVRRGPFTDTVPAAAATLLGALYLGGLGGAIAALRILPPAGQGPARILLLMAIVMAADTLAFFTGSAFGRHKLAPAISPGKTVEGALGGLAGGVLGALAIQATLLPIPWVHAVALGLAVAAAAIAGDLFESLLKRWAGVKDSGALFPGHGGMLDRLDSLLFGGAVLYYYFSLFG